MKITGSLIVCVAAAGFTATALLVNPDPAPRGTAAVAASNTLPNTMARITIAQFAFTDVTVAPGTAVTVNNLDGDDHTMTSTDGLFDSGLVAAGGAIAVVAPTAPGVYSFVCVIHPSMSGQLTVQL